MLKRSAANSRTRRRVALLMDAIEDDYQEAILRGAAVAAQQEGLELWCLAGGIVGSQPGDRHSARNFLFDLLKPGDFDGLMVLSSSLSNHLGAQAFEQWLGRYSGVPMVSVGVELGSCQSVVADGGPGMKELVLHLIQQHNHRRIAFIRGPVASVGAEERFAAYRQALAQFGIAEDPRLILQGNWLRESGAVAIRELFDDRGMAVDAVSAIVCANDYMALGAMDALRDRGVAVPTHIAVTGFDDGAVGKCAVPPLTTVQQPTELMGREGIRRLLAAMDGHAEKPLTGLAATLVGRGSCGCLKTAGLLNRHSGAKVGRSLEIAVLERRSLIFAELSRSARGSFVGAGVRWEERLVTALLTDLRGQHDDAFLSALDQLMAGVQREGGDLTQVGPMLGTLRRLLLDCAPNELDAIVRIGDLVDAARALVGEWLVRGEALRRMEVVEFSRALSRVSAGLLRSSDGAPERASFEQDLRHLGVSALSLGLLEEPGRASGQCQCLAAFDASGGLRSNSHFPAHFPASNFAAPGVFGEGRGAVLVQALVYESEPLGLLTVPLGRYHGSLYEQMRETFASACAAFVWKRGRAKRP